jgi:hypothetical protein
MIRQLQNFHSHALAVISNEIQAGFGKTIDLNGVDFVSVMMRSWMSFSPYKAGGDGITLTLLERLWDRDRGA